MEQLIISKLKKYKWRSLNKALYYFKRKYPEINEKLVRQLFENSREISFVKKLNKSLMTRTFSASRRAYQMDIYFGKSKYDLYLLAVNVNTKYAWIHKLKSKATADVLPVLKLLVRDLNPASLESDDEGAFTDYRTVNFLKDNEVQQKVVLQGLHSDLGILNRCCRTLNELKINDRLTIYKAVKRYNKSYNSSIGMSPNDMQSNPDEEIAYIIDRLYERDEKDKLMLTSKLKKGDKVRYIRDDAKLFEKGRHRYELSKYYYIIEDVLSPYKYTIIAKDGTVKTIPRFRLYKLKDNSKLTYAPTMEDKSSHFIFKRILDVEHTKDYVQAKPRGIVYVLEMIKRNEDGSKKTKEIRVSQRELRSENPTKPALLELKYVREYPEMKEVIGI